MARSKARLNLLFITDPLSQFDIRRETTLWIMSEAAKRGHGIFVSGPKDLSVRDGEVRALAKKIRVLKPGMTQWYREEKSERRPVTDFDALLLRKDPPFDLAYLRHLELLAMAEGLVYMMNSPQGILLGNEKLLPMLWPQIAPATLISANRQELIEFVAQQKSGAILKPLGSSGGRGVFFIKNTKAPNLGVILESITQEFNTPIIAQAYAPVHRAGDRRVMLLGGEILGSFVRRPAQGEHRANLHSGGAAYPSRITAQDRALVKRIQPVLEALGLDFVGLDLIGGTLIEVNVTSPMGLNEMNQTGYPRSEVKLVDFLEKRVKNFAAKSA